MVAVLNDQNGPSTALGNAAGRFPNPAAADALGAVRRNNRCDAADTRGYGATLSRLVTLWGAWFTMVARPFDQRSTAHRWAVQQRPDKGDRLVLACEHCPPTTPSKRRSMRWATVARQVAAALDADPAAVRAALAAALDAERQR